MAYYDDPLVDPTQDFDTQQDVLTQQAARIKALRDRYAKPYVPDNTEIGGYTLSTGQRIPGRIMSGGWGQIAQAAAPLLADFTAGRQEAGMNREQAALRQREQADAMEQMSNIPQGTPAQAAVTPLTPMDDEGNPMPSFPAVAAKPPERGAVLKAAMAMQRNPLLRATGQQYMADQLIKEPEREENRAERAAKAAADRAEALRKQQADIAARAEVARQHNETLRAIAEGNQAARREATAARKEQGHNLTYMGPDPDDPTKGLWADPRNPSSPPVSGPVKTKDEPPLKPLPAAEQKKWDDHTRLIGQIDKITATSEPGATGIGKGSVIKYGGDLGAWAVNHWSTAGEQARRAAIDAIGTAKVHDLTGAAFSLKELPRYNAFIPLVTDTEDQVRVKLGQLREVAEMERENVRSAARTQGYLSPEGTGPARRQPQTGGASGSWDGGGAAPKETLRAAPKAGDVVDGYRFKGGNVNDGKNWEKVQ